MNDGVTRRKLLVVVPTGAAGLALGGCALLRGGATDDDLRDAITAVWAARTDRYSEIRTEQTSELPRIEMSYIGG